MPRIIDESVPAPGYSCGYIGKIYKGPVFTVFTFKDQNGATDSAEKGPRIKMCSPHKKRCLMAGMTGQDEAALFP